MFQYAPPSGYLALCSSNLPDTTISPAQSTQATDYFNTRLYTGDGQTTQAITGVGFQPDWLWIKERSSTSDHVLVDSSRGASKFLVSNSTQAESTATSIHQSFDSDGFTVGSSGATNQDNETYVSWNWKANGGTTSSNTDGDITSTVQANTDAGFSIVTFTGNGTDGSTVGHGLGVKPAWYIVKDRDTNSAGHWMVYHHELSNPRDNMFLNLEAAANPQGFGTTDPASATTFKPAKLNYNNVSGNDYVAYVFAEVKGYSRFGHYIATGTSGDSAPFVYTGFRPAFVMVKNSSSSSYADWVLFDNKRNPHNIVDEYLNTFSEAEFTGGSTYPFMDFTSNGFKLRLGGTGSQVAYAVNRASGDRYIYAAFAEQPFKFSNAR